MKKWHRVISSDLHLPKQLKRTIFLLLLISPFYIAFFKAYYMRFAAFGCFDECFNYTAGYFIGRGRVLYEQIFYNHQMLMAYLSYGIQLLLNPQSLYQLLLYHRMFVFFFALLMNIFFLYRFGLIGFGFALLFEATKFYFMGSLFLPESLIVYPLVYLFALAWQNLKEHTVSKSEIVFSGILTWVVVFLREPFVLVALVLYGAVLWGKFTKEKRISALLFLFLTLLTIFSTSMPDYLYQVGIVNRTVFKTENSANSILGAGLLKIFLYPFIIFFEGKATFIRSILVGLSGIFTFLLLYLVKRRRIKEILFIVVILGLANIRIVPPGWMFFEAFHMLPWYGMFIFAILLLMKELYSFASLQKGFFFSILAFILLFCYSIWPTHSFLYEYVDRDIEFKLNFDHYFVFGQAIKFLAQKNDRVFIDLSDDLLYWQTGLDSSYTYAVYNGPVIQFSHFTNARMTMFQKSPPDFYYYHCSPKMYESPLLPSYRKSSYIQLYYVNRPSCLYMKQSKLKTITPEMLRNINVLRFSFPQENLSK